MFFVYGFTAFDEYPDNVTERIIAALPAFEDVRTRVFDVLFDRAMFESAFDAANPSLILGLGQTPNGERLRVEQFARNAMSPRGGPVCPIEQDEAGERRMGWSLPDSHVCEASVDAGSYVCNFSMWVADSWARAHAARVAFLHVPRTFDPHVAAKYVCSVLDVNRP